MDRNADIRHRFSFQVKKWTLYAFCLIGIFGAIFIGLMAKTLVNFVVDEAVKEFPDKDHLKPGDVDAIKSMTKVLLYIGVVIAIPYNLLGLMGAYKENYCMTLSYGILMGVASVGAIVTAFKNPYYFVTAAIDVFVCSIAFSFALDLHLIRRLAFATPIAMATGMPVHYTTVQMAPTPITGIGQQYTGVAKEGTDDHKNKAIPYK